MKRLGERDSSPQSRTTSKRPRDRERDREGSRRGDDGLQPVVSDNSRNYYRPSGSSLLTGSKRQERSRSRERDKQNRRDERGSDPHHRQQHHQVEIHSLASSSRTTVRGGSAAKVKGDNRGAVAGLPWTGGNAAAEYKSLLISNFASQLTDEQVEDGLFHEFKKFGDVSIKISHTPELGRVAFVNFRHPEHAREARHAKGRLVLHDRTLKVEPVYQKKKNSNSSDMGLMHNYQYKQRSLSPVHANVRDQRTRHGGYIGETGGLSREKERPLEHYSLHDERSRSCSFSGPEEELMPEDDQRATRNLFIGNLDHNISENELRRAFEKYGIIEEVVIKRPARGTGGAYAFLKFQNLDMAHRAKVAMSGRLIGRNAVKIGYGKANPTTRLWVGGLGPNTSLAALAREFDRYGSITTIDYVKGDSFAYVQYESLDAAQAACAQMRGFPLGGPDRRLRVDFAKTEPIVSRCPQHYAAGPVAMHYDMVSDGYGRQKSLEWDVRARDRTPPRLLPDTGDHSFLEGSWSSPVKGRDHRSSGDVQSRTVRSRSTEQRPNDRDNVSNLPRVLEEKQKHRNLSDDHGSVSIPSYEERGKNKFQGPSVVHGPEQNQRDQCPSESVIGKDQNTSFVVKCLSERRSPKEFKELSNPKKKEEHNCRTSENENKVKQSTEPKLEAKKIATLAEFAHTLPLAWNGVLVLKNSSFPTVMHILEGELAVLNSLMKDSTAGGNKLSQLKIAQRLRLDQPKLDEVTRRIKQGSPNGYAVLLATQAMQRSDGQETLISTEPGLQQRLLRNLVSYLKQKQAAGVVSLPVGGPKDRDSTGMLYAFPPCEFSQQYLKSALRTLGKLEEHLVVVIVRDSA
ncbi:putative RNA-binding protein 15B [Protopterus annectens]|uniref:putative RNA-binding protein 15B n=1 Tax=Protopterus annectens TaxID=7888 RepID=UPI001CFB3772|nr:putative RNA-binding protein 15B [Protopterus annectens]